ncbi:hypothetical protein SE1039_03210 [Staphylococcus equorum]|nr:hypothetical protein SE1039_03210 [Staphylococcus equorum]
MRKVKMQFIFAFKIVFLIAVFILNMSKLWKINMVGKRVSNPLIFD